MMQTSNLTYNLYANSRGGEIDKNYRSCILLMGRILFPVILPARGPHYTNL